MFYRAIAAGLLALGVNLAYAQTVQLISENEAKLPPAGTEPVARAITRGPGVKLVTPETVTTKTFPFKVVFEPRGTAKIDLGSVRVLYLKKPEIDLTERIKATIHADGIDVPSTSAPRGEHLLRIQVRDDKGRLGTATIKLQVN